MLRRMSPEHRFGTAARLSAEVLGGVADEALALDTCGEVLGDALRILTSEHIKVQDICVVSWDSSKASIVWAAVCDCRPGGVSGTACPPAACFRVDCRNGEVDSASWVAS